MVIMIAVLVVATKADKEKGANTNAATPQLQLDLDALEERIR